MPLRAPGPAVTGYRETPRTYRSTAVLAVAIVAGFALDTALGGGPAHPWAWLAAFVVVVGLDALLVRTSQRLRTIIVTGTALVVGPESIDRARIEGVESPAPVGTTSIAPSPRDAVVVGVRLADGVVLGVPTRRPNDLVVALGFRAPNALLDVRVAEPADVDELPEIEQRADTLFQVGGFGPLPAASLPDVFAASLFTLVAGRPPVGFARVDLVDGLPHLEQLSVLPSHMRRGVGGALLEAAVERARVGGHAAITLITFADVAWNGPFYARHGFAPVADASLGPGLRALRVEEAADGLDAMGRRVVMRRALA